jgi:hypothetical protein
MVCLSLNLGSKALIAALPLIPVMDHSMLVVVVDVLHSESPSLPVFSSPPEGVKMGTWSPI